MVSNTPCCGAFSVSHCVRQSAMKRESHTMVHCRDCARYGNVQSTPLVEVRIECVLKLWEVDGAAAVAIDAAHDERLVVIGEDHAEA